MADRITYPQKTDGTSTINAAEVNEIKSVANSHATDVEQLQTDVSGKANTNHTHTSSQITDFQANVSLNTNVAANTAKLAGIDAGAKDDQTGSEIVGLINGELGNTDWQSGGSGGGSGTDDQTASEVPTTVSGGVTQNNVQLELQAIHTKIDNFGGWVLYETASGSLPSANVPTGSIAWVGATPETAVLWRWNGSSWFNSSQTTSPAQGTGTALDLTSTAGTSYGTYAIPVSDSSYTIAENSVDNGFADVIGNWSSQPPVAGSTQRGGDAFVSGIIMKMYVGKRLGEFYHYFTNESTP